MAEDLIKEKVEAPKVKLALREVGVDTDPALVLKWTQEGRELYFKDGDDFLELETEVVASLKRNARMRYDLAKAITLGEDVIETVEDGARGWSKDYAITPGTSTSRTFVKGKDPNKDYYLSRADSVDYHMARSGFKVTRDPNISVGGRKETCTYNTVGGQRQTELVLLERPNKVAKQIQAENKKNRDALTKSTRSSYAEKSNQSEFEYGQSMDDLSVRK